MYETWKYYGMEWNDVFMESGGITSSLTFWQWKSDVAQTTAGGPVEKHNVPEWGKKGPIQREVHYEHLRNALAVLK